MAEFSVSFAWPGIKSKSFAAQTSNLLILEAYAGMDVDSTRKPQDRKWRGFVQKELVSSDCCLHRNGTLFPNTEINK